jgi:hypothetical protein
MPRQSASGGGRTRASSSGSNGWRIQFGVTNVKRRVNTASAAARARRTVK